MIATTAAKLSCQPTSSAARGLSASVAAAASSSAYQRDAGRSGRAHDARALDGGPAAGQRHVQRDQREREEQPHAEPDADDRRQPEHERAEQHHVLAACRD
jgi:hypothetical protein